jgi:uncharacterized tellurite resistance protein B-like protein
MLNSFRRFIDEFLTANGPEATPQAHEHQLQLATAALLMEMAQADFAEAPAERDHVLALLQREFALSAHEAERIAGLGADAAKAAVSLYDFTRTLDQALSTEDKVRIIEMLWQVAYADGALDKYEEHLLRKLADLLHLTHRQLIQAKHRVLQARGVQL